MASAQFFNFNTCASILTEDCYRYGNDPSCGSNGVTYRNKSVIKHHINIYTFFLVVKQFMLHCVYELTTFVRILERRAKEFIFFSKGVLVGGGLVKFLFARGVGESGFEGLLSNFNFYV